MSKYSTTPAKDWRLRESRFWCIDYYHDNRIQSPSLMRTKERGCNASERRSASAWTCPEQKCETLPPCVTRSPNYSLLQCTMRVHLQAARCVEAIHLECVRLKLHSYEQNSECSSKGLRVADASFLNCT
eukprot:scaffold34693_cov256-Amphora_coffeaeformis.AAC.2